LAAQPLMLTITFPDSDLLALVHMDQHMYMNVIDIIRLILKAPSPRMSPTAPVPMLLLLALCCACTVEPSADTRGRTRKQVSQEGRAHQPPSLAAVAIVSTPGTLHVPGMSLPPPQPSPDSISYEQGEASSEITTAAAPQKPSVSYENGEAE